MAFLSVQDVVIMFIGIIVLAVWLFIYITNLKYANIFDQLDSSEFRLNELYFMGYGVLEKLKYDYYSKNNRELKKNLSVLYDEKFADYYLRVVRSQQVTFFLLFLVFAFIMYGFTAEIGMLGMMIGVAILLAFHAGGAPKRKIEERSDELMSEFSEVVSKLALLTDAGMILKEAWEEIAYSEEGTIYNEMKRAVEDMKNGVSEIDAISSFGQRCMVPEIKKFTSTLVQGLSKGNKELSVMLSKQSAEVWDIKRQIVRRKGEKAQSKLLIPMILMFIGILLMIMIPIFSNLGM